MNSKTEIFGAKAFVYLKYDGKLRELADIISTGLMLPAFWFDTDQDPPHEETAMCECLGCELWLKQSDAIQGYTFSIQLETSHCLNESFSNQMHDLSPWLARYISEICEIESSIIAE